MDPTRIMVFTPNDEFVREIPRSSIMAHKEFEQVNGQHYLRLVTSVVLEKEQRLVTFDRTGAAHEYVVSSEDYEHASGKRPFGDYSCPWSLQHDMAVCTVSAMPGVQTPCSASDALDAALSGTTRWVRGTVTVSKYAGASMYQRSGWEALSVLVATWGGEVDVTIEVGTNGITARKVNLYAHVGSEVAVRRFDYGRDVSGVKRNVGSDPVACRIIPRGKGEETDGGGYGRKITIESVNDGVDWLQNDESFELFALSDGNGGREPTTVYADNSEIEDPQELKDWGLSVLEAYTTPQVSYEMSVVQLQDTGEGPQGVGLGDEIQCVDLEFGDVPLRLSGRVMSMDHDRLEPRLSTVTIGNGAKALVTSLASGMGSVSRNVTELQARSAGTAYYLDHIVDNLNAVINATGGYWYVTDGEGVRTYDAAVSDPLVGDEASRVVEMRGGYIRIADSRTAQGEWDWKTLIESGHIAAELVTVANITAGTIRSANGSTVIDLDNDSVTLGLGTRIGDMSLADAIDDARKYATEYLHFDPSEGLTIGAIDSAVRNVLTSSRQVYRTDAGDIAWYGLDSSSNVWKLFIDSAQINDTLQFGSFAWIARQNGNMTVKKVG